MPILEILESRDALSYGNPEDVIQERNVLWNQANIPICSNSVAVPQITDITDNPSVYDIGTFLTGITKPIESFEFNDTHVYTRDVTVDNVRNSILLDELESDLPLLRNLKPVDIISDVIESLNLFSLPPTTSAELIETFDPVHRRIDVRFPRARRFDPFAEIAGRMPLTANLCSLGSLSEIVECLDLPELTLPLRDVEPLSVVEAEIDPDADLTKLADDMVDLILAKDVVPFMPCWEDVHEGDLAKMLDGLVSGSTISDTPFKSILSDLRLEGVSSLSGPVPDLRRVVRARDVVEQMLWDIILPELPIRKHDADEWLSAAVDEMADRDLTMESDAFSSAEEPLADEVARLFRKYKLVSQGSVSGD
jgi:hypothetical protein